MLPHSAGDSPIGGYEWDGSMTPMSTKKMSELGIGKPTPKPVGSKAESTTCRTPYIYSRFPYKFRKSILFSF